MELVFHELKQKIWDTYKLEYNSMFKDKEEIIKDYKNFIPDNDIIYNIILESKEYEKIKKDVEKYRLEVMKLWDKHKKENDNLINNIIRKEIPDSTVFIVNKELDIIDYKDNKLILGVEIDKKEPLKILLDMHMKILTNNMKKYSEEEKEQMKKAILELAVLNEYTTRITDRSCYQAGTPSLLYLKRFLYPYWLMYLGIPKEEFNNYMRRDKIVFDQDKYAYEKELKKMNIEEFIDFCIRNKRYIVREIKYGQPAEELL